MTKYRQFSYEQKQQMCNIFCTVTKWAARVGLTIVYNMCALVTNLFNFVMLLRKFIRRNIDEIHFSFLQLFLRQIQTLQQTHAPSVEIKSNKLLSDCQNFFYRNNSRFVLQILTSWLPSLTEPDYPTVCTVHTRA